MAANRPNEELTSTERECLRHYRAHLTKYGAPPSLRQLGAYLGVHFNAANHCLKSLIKKGRIDYVDSEAHHTHEEKLEEFGIEVTVRVVTMRRLKAPPEKKP